MKAVIGDLKSGNFTAVEMEKNKISSLNRFLMDLALGDDLTSRHHIQKRPSPACRAGCPTALQLESLSDTGHSKQLSPVWIL